MFCFSVEDEEGQDHHIVGEDVGAQDEEEKKEKKKEVILRHWLNIHAYYEL